MAARIVAALLALILLLPGAGWAIRLRWVDDRGVVHLTNDMEAVPEEYRNTAEIIGAGSESMADIAAKKARKAVLKFKPLGKTMIIPLEVAGKKTPMVYDPDIDATVITHRLQTDAGLEKISGSEAIMHSKSGALVPVYMVEIPTIKFGNITLEKVQAVVRDFEEEGIEADGILGQSDLEEYDVTVDVPNKTITIKPLQ